MKKPLVWIGLLVGLMATAPLIALFFVGDVLFGLPLVPFDLFAWLTRVLPGPLVTFGIDSMVDTLILIGFDVSETAKTAERMMAVTMSLGASMSLVLVYVLLRQFVLRKGHLWYGAILGLVATLINTIIHASLPFSSTAPAVIGYLWIVVLFVSWGQIIEWGISQWEALPEKEVLADESAMAVEKVTVVEQISRREFLIRMGSTTAAMTAVGAGLSFALGTKDQWGVAAEPEQTSQGPTPQPSSGDQPGAPAPGTRAEITPVDDHYLIDINPRPPVIDGDTYKLVINGMVDNELALSLDEIKNNYTISERYITLSCISNRVGGDLIGTTKWTGASLQEILADAGIQNGAKFIEIRSIDGYHETVALDLIESEPRIMLAFYWDDQPLTHEHGFPLRIWIPDRFGMKQPRWITEMEVIAEDRDGYWVERSWSKEAIVRTTSVIDTVADPYQAADGTMMVPIGGIAYAGAREIGAVEVRIDNGEWQTAHLFDPLSDTTWVLWRYDWPFEAGLHTFEVRCYEGDLTPQISAVADPRPDGATGIHSVQKNV
ncbi:MAG: molybdopterin-dependent oxidoreductase [Anaerolineae bacterium]|nr:molybdopterin-dependent oxidoreductase [Anaerolineae bacterium]